MPWSGVRPLAAVALASALLLTGCGKDDPTRPRLPAGWAKSYSTDVYSAGMAVKQTADGGYIVAGWAGPAVDDVDVLLLKTDAAGDSLWARTFAAPNWAAGVSVLQTAEGGYVVLADYHGNSGEFWLIRTDPYGGMVWNQFKGYGDRDEVPSEVQQTADGGYILIGTTHLGGGDYDSWLVKIGPGGETHWNQTKGFSDRQETGVSVQQTSDLGYIMLGTTYGGGSGHRDGWLVKTYANGNTHWYETFPFGFAVSSHTIRKTADGAYVGMADIDITGDRQAIVIFTCDESGNGGWAKTNDGSGDFWGGEVQQTADGGFMVAGTNRPAAGSPSDFCLIKFDQAGETLWTRTFDAGDDECRAGAQTADGGYILCGSTVPQGVVGRHVFLVKTDPAGAIQ
jgi:hypothetical protein